MTRRLLFVTSTRIGDAVLSSGLLGHFLDADPEVRVTVACGVLAAPLFQAVPGLERLIVMEKRRRSGHWIDLWRQVVGTSWETVVDLRRSALAYTLPFVRRRLVLPRQTEEIHRVEALGALVGRRNDPPAPRLWCQPEHQAHSELLIPDGGPVLAVGPTANWAVKTWRPEYFAALVERLTKPDGILPGARIAIFGGPSEREQATPLIEAVPASRRIDLVGRIDLPTSGACLGRCAFYVGNDSALMHLAAASGIPTLGLFGPTNETYYAPWGPRSATVRTQTPLAEIFPPDFDHRIWGTLMDTLTVESAEEAATSLWKRTRRDGSEAIQ